MPSCSLETRLRKARVVFRDVDCTHEDHQVDGKLEGLHRNSHVTGFTYRVHRLICFEDVYARKMDVINRGLSDIQRCRSDALQALATTQSRVFRRLSKMVTKDKTGVYQKCQLLTIWFGTPSIPRRFMAIHKCRLQEQTMRVIRLATNTYLWTSISRTWRG